MSNFQQPGQKILWIETRLDALESFIRKYIQHGGIRSDGSGTNTIGVLEEHDHTGTGTGGVLTGDRHDSFGEYNEIAAPATPASGRVRLYAKADGNLYQKDDAGLETNLAAAGGHGAELIIDDDADTSVNTETSADEDIVRVVTGGTARARFTSSGLLIVNAMDLLLYSDDGVTLKGTWDGATGHANFGSNLTPGALTIVTAQETMTDPGGTVSAFNTVVTMAMTAGNANAMYGTFARVRAAGTFTASGLWVGVYSDISRLSGSPTVNDFRNFFADSSTATGLTIVDRYGLYVANSAAAAVTNQCGIYLENMTKGGTLNRAIYSAGGLSVHAGAARFGSVTAPTNTTDGDLTATRLIVPNATILHSAIIQLGGPVVIPTNGQLRFSDADDSNYVGLTAPATAQTENYVYALPDDDPSNGQVLAVKSTAASPLITTEWIAAGGAATIAVEENNVNVASDITTLDFGTGFDITAAAGEAEIALDLTELNLTQTILLMAASGSPTTTAGCATVAQVEAGTNDIDYFVLDFDATTKEYAVWNMVMPDNWNAGTITYKVIWTTTSSTSTHTAVFGLQGLARGDAETIDTAYGSAVEVSDDATATANQVLISAESAAVTLGGTPAAGDWVAFRLYRDPANGSDDLNVDARVLGVRIEYGTTGVSA